MTYTVRRPEEVLAVFDTFGAALAWANDRPDLAGGIGVFWGEQGSAMNLAEWRAWANRSVERLLAAELSPERLLEATG